MGLFSRKATTPPSPVTVASKTVIFDDMAKAQMFAAGFSSGSGDPLLDFISLNNSASSYGGHVVRSTVGKELTVYGYQQYITAQDRIYLSKRDPTAKMILEKPARDRWARLPVTNIPALDSFLSAQATLGLVASAVAADKLQARDGGALLYLEATGPPDSPIQRGDRPLLWRFIPAHRVITDPNDAKNGIELAEGAADPLLMDHGIESASIYITEDAKRANSPTRVHGSRLLRIPNMESDSEWWFSESILDSIYDDLWNMRDVVWSRTRQMFQGSPIVVTADLKADPQAMMRWLEMDEAEFSEVVAEVDSGIRALRSGHTDSLGLLRGVEVKRLEGQSLPDPKEDLKALASRISHPTPFSPKMILASTQGNIDVGALDNQLYEAEIQRGRDLMVHPVLSKSILIGKRMGIIPARIQFPPTHALEWPRLRPLEVGEEVRIWNTAATAAERAWKIGRLVPPAIDRLFPKDPSVALEPALASKGRGRDGSSLDEASPESDDFADVEDRIAAELREALREAREDEQ